MTKVVMNPSGIRAVLNHPQIKEDIDARADRIRNAAGDGFRTRPRPQRIQRYGNQVRTENHTGRKRQADNNVIMKSLDAGR